MTGRPPPAPAADPSPPKVLLDCRLGGPRNWLIVQFAGTLDNLIEAWLVDYDRWRDEHWSVADALQAHHAGDRSGPVIHRMSLFDVDWLFKHATAERARLGLPEGWPCSKRSRAAD